MIEIVFGDSACGSLKTAQHYGGGEYSGGAISIIVGNADGSKPTKAEIKAAKRKAEKELRLEWERAVPMGGSSADVFGLSLSLSIGDISENQPGIKRMQALERLYSIYPEGVGNEAVREESERVDKALKTVGERAKAGEALRIWYSSQPDELCGFYWFMDQLEQWGADNGKVFAVKLPEWEADGEENIVRKISWGEVSAGEWHRYASLQEPVSLAFRKSCAAYWKEIQKENSSLRAVLNGQLVSVPEDLYDDFIWREIELESGEFKEGMVIGHVLGKYRLGIGDCWIALRIEEMLRVGSIEVVRENGSDGMIYGRTLKKSDS